MKLSLGYITAANKKEAKDIVMALLEEELIACANIIDGIDSYFIWDDAIHQANEVVVIIKTRQRNQNGIIKLVKVLHSYESPCVVFASLENGNNSFLRWIESTT